MTKTTFLFAALLLTAASFFAQTEKGARPISQSTNQPINQTRAVVVGISDYQDPAIPDLRFADRDAEAFANFLQATAGGALPTDRIALLKNAQATAGKIIAALEWLIAESKAGDRAIIYFSGHGDVERVTKFQRGYLLAHDSPGTTYMAGGSLPVGFLSDVITTLSEAGVQVVMISDACRSGKLAGSGNGGTQATSAALAQQFANEIKILSCQPEEFSLEGEQWGGGRGCFSFHLVDALTGLADANSDGSVNLLETGRYLEDVVPAQTAPHSQIPMTLGSKNTALAVVDQVTLADLHKRKHAPTLSPIDAKGFEEMVLANLDTSVQQLYAAFTAAMERGDLMSPPGASANDYYGQLLNKPGIEKLKGLMTRNLAAALQDEAQVVINQLLRTDPQIVDDAFSAVARYDHLPAYLARAAGLLGEGHYMWRFLKAREYFFKSKTCRKANYPELAPDSIFNLAQAMLDSALLFDDEAAYVWFEKGYLLFWNTSDTRGMMECFEKASLRSAEWLLAKYYTGRILTNYGIDYEKGIAIFQEVVAKDSMFLPVYRELGLSTGDKTWFEAYVRNMREYERVHPGKVPATYYNYLGSCLMQLQRNEEAVQALLLGAGMSNHQHPLIYVNLGRAYSALEQHENAIQAYRKAVEINPLLLPGHVELGYQMLFYSNEPVEVVKPYLLQIVRLKPQVDDGWRMLTSFFIKNGQLDSAENTVRQWMTFCPKTSDHDLWLAHIYKQAGKKDAARQALQNVLDCNDELDGICFFNKLIAFNALGITDSVNVYRENMREVINNPAYFNYLLSIVHAFSDQDAVALNCLEKAFQQGGKQTDGAFQEVLLYLHTFRLYQTPEYKALMKKHFPDQVKD